MVCEKMRFEEVNQTFNSTSWEAIVDDEWVALIATNDASARFRVYTKARLRFLGEFDSLEEAKKAVSDWWTESHTV